MDYLATFRRSFLIFFVGIDNEPESGEQGRRPPMLETERAMLGWDALEKALHGTYRVWAGSSGVVKRYELHTA